LEGNTKLLPIDSSSSSSSTVDLCTAVVVLSENPPLLEEDTEGEVDDEREEGSGRMDPRGGLLA
jgi:hypothetical protein